MQEAAMFETGLFGWQCACSSPAAGAVSAAAIGYRYLELGADLVICGLREAVLAETAAAFKAELDAEVETHVCDVRSAEVSKP